MSPGRTHSHTPPADNNMNTQAHGGPRFSGQLPGALLREGGRTGAPRGVWAGLGEGPASSVPAALPVCPYTSTGRSLSQLPKSLVSAPASMAHRQPDPRPICPHRVSRRAPWGLTRLPCEALFGGRRKLATWGASGMKVPLPLGSPPNRLRLTCNQIVGFS